MSSTEITKNEKLKKTVDDLAKTIVDAKDDINEFKKSIKEIYDDINIYMDAKTQEVQEIEDELPGMIENYNKMVKMHTTLYTTLNKLISNSPNEPTPRVNTTSNGIIEDFDSSVDDSDVEDNPLWNEEEEKQQHNNRSIHDNVNNLLRNTDADGVDAMNEIAGDYEEIINLKESRRKTLKQCEEENEKNIQESLVIQNLEAVLAAELSTITYITNDKKQILLDQFHNYMIKHKTVPIVNRITQSLARFHVTICNRDYLTDTLTEGL